jgi:hypothetical protein
MHCVAGWQAYPASCVLDVLTSLLTFKADFAYSRKGVKLAVADISCRSSLMSRL